MVFVYDEKQFPGGVLGVNPWQSKIMISAFLLHKNFSRKTFDQFFINQPMQKLMEYIANYVSKLHFVSIKPLYCFEVYPCFIDIFTLYILLHN